MWVPSVVVHILDCPICVRLRRSHGQGRILLRLTMRVDCAKDSTRLQIVLSIVFNAENYYIGPYYIQCPNWRRMLSSTLRSSTRKRFFLNFWMSFCAGAPAAGPLQAYYRRAGPRGRPEVNAHKNNLQDVVYTQ